MVAGIYQQNSSLFDSLQKYFLYQLYRQKFLKNKIRKKIRTKNSLSQQLIIDIIFDLQGIAKYLVVSSFLKIVSVAENKIILFYVNNIIIIYKLQYKLIKKLRQLKKTSYKLRLCSAFASTIYIFILYKTFYGFLTINFITFEHKYKLKIKNFIVKVIIFFFLIKFFFYRYIRILFIMQRTTSKIGKNLNRLFLPYLLLIKSQQIFFFL